MTVTHPFDVLRQVLRQKQQEIGTAGVIVVGESWVKVAPLQKEFPGFPRLCSRWRDTLSPGLQPSKLFGIATGRRRQLGVLRAP
jgi:hypothetical protein